jgi:hypothetical protein
MTPPKIEIAIIPPASRREGRHRSRDRHVEDLAQEEGRDHAIALERTIGARNRGQAPAAMA